MSTFKTEINLNSITSSATQSVALSPETIRFFNNPYYSFLQVYCLSANGRKWFGKLEDLGNQLKVPNTIKINPEINEYLKLSNSDSVSISLAYATAVDLLIYETREQLPNNCNKYPRLIVGAELAPGLKYRKELNLIVIQQVIINQNTAELGYLTEDTQTLTIDEYGSEFGNEVTPVVEVGFTETTNY
jgi:hypothetical protein